MALTVLFDAAENLTSAAAAKMHASAGPIGQSDPAASRDDFWFLLHIQCGMMSSPDFIIVCPEKQRSKQQKGNSTGTVKAVQFILQFRPLSLPSIFDSTIDAEEKEIFCVGKHLFLLANQ